MPNSESLEPVRSRRVSAGDIAYEHLKAAIVSRRLAPGEPLAEEQLAQELMVSRTPLREAIKRLEAEELVIRQPNGRLTVAPLSIRQVQELYSVRTRLEGLIAREATVRMTPAALQHLQRITGYIEAAARSGDMDEVVRRGEEFHSLLYRMSGNRYAVRLLEQLKDLIGRYRRIGPTMDADRALAAAAEHRQLYEFIVEGNDLEADVCMQRHVESSLSTVVTSLGKLLGPKEE